MMCPHCSSWLDPVFIDEGIVCPRCERSPASVSRWNPLVDGHGRVWVGLERIEGTADRWRGVELEQLEPGPRLKVLNRLSPRELQLVAARSWMEEAQAFDCAAEE